MALVGELDDLEPRVAAEVAEILELAESAPPELHGEIRATVEAKLRAGSLSRMAMATSAGLWKPYRHSVLLNVYLTKLMRREITRLLITMPPQHGKSVTTSKHFPAAYLHRFPEHRIILTSYEADFAAGWGGEVRGLIDENVEILGLEVKQSSRAKKRWDLVGHTGGMMTAGMGGPVTGKGANLLIIDDPVKNEIEAASPALQERNWSWWEKVAYSRIRHDKALDDPANELAVNGEPIIVVIQTRWHEADLAGKLLDEEGSVENDGEWVVLNLPALAEDEDDPLGRVFDEALCPELHPQAELEKTRSTRSASAWSSIWQQRPSPKGGGRFKKDDFRYWGTVHADVPYYKLVAPAGVGEILIAKSEALRFTTVDTAATTKKRSDYTVISTWDLLPPRVVDARECPSLLLLVDRVRERVETTDHLRMLERVNELHDPAWHGVESASFGLSLIQSAIRKGIRIRELDADNDKWSRSEIAGVWCSNGRLFWPAHADWLDVWEHEHLLFPDGAHDDQVDTTSYAAIEADTQRQKPKKQKKELTLRQRVLRQKKQRPLHPQLGRL